MQVLNRNDRRLSDREKAWFAPQPEWVKFIYVERQVGTDRLVYTITYPADKNTKANRDAFMLFANGQVNKAVQELIEFPLIPPDVEERELQPEEDIGKSL